jgi:selenide,water dikinase
VSAKATRIDPDASTVTCDDGVSRSFDIVSIDVGSMPGISDIPGALENAVPLKPVAPFLARSSGVLSAAAKDGATPRRVVVVGGGAGGVELVLAMHHRCSAVLQREPGRAIRFALVSENLLPGHVQRLQEIVSVILADRGIALERGRVERLTPGCVHMSEARSLLSDFVVFATGASAPAWLAHSGLATDERGFISVDSQLRSVSHANVFAAGDVATMVARPAPKSGVYAVRAGPVLAENLIAVRRGRSPQTSFEPQRRALALIASGNQHATLSYGSLALSAHWLWRWKDRIDRRFVRKYAAV